MDTLVLVQSLKNLDEAQLYSLLKTYNHAVQCACPGTCRHCNALAVRDRIRHELTSPRHQRHRKVA